MDALQELTRAGGRLGQFFTPAYMAQVRAYVRPLRLDALVDLGVSFAEYALIFALGLHWRLHRWCERKVAGWFPTKRALPERVWKGPGLGAALLFVALMQLGRIALSLPESIYFGFVREKRLGLTHYTAAGYAYDSLKQYALGLTVFVFGMVALYALMKHLPRAWGPLLGAVGGLALLAAALLDPLRDQVVYSYRPLPDGAARRAVVAVLEKGQVPYQNVVVENLSRSTVRGDAYFAGEGPTRLIVVGDTLLGRFSPKELAEIVAHEMGHLREKVWPRRVASALAFFLGLLALQAFLKAAGTRGWFGLAAPDDVAGYLVILFLFFLVQLAAGPVVNRLSRARESAADDYALHLTNDPQDFLSMMAKLTAQNRSDPTPWGWYEAWQWDHPASARRLAHALRYAHAHHIALHLPPPQDARKGALARVLRAR